MTAPKAGETVLALFPTSRGFGFVLFHGETSLIDWGIKGIRWKNKNFLALHVMKALITQHQPDVLVLEDAGVKRSRRHMRIRELHRLVGDHAQAQKIKVRRFPRTAVHAHFGVHTKYAVAQAVAELLPVLAPRLPPERKPWMSEDARQSLFDAAALALVYFASTAKE
jgi:hypothetical protein